MTKTPDEIKKGLECCMDYQNCTEGEDPQCPYYDAQRCMEALLADALALIQQLEAELSDAKNNHQHTIDIAERQKDQIDKLKKVIVRLNAERDAAVAGLKSNCTCPECKYFSDDIQEPCRGCKPTDSKFEWRGVQKEE